MKWMFFVVVVAAFAQTAQVFGGPETSLGKNERKEVEARLLRFYSGSVTAMDHPVPKFGASDGHPQDLNVTLKRKTPGYDDPLLIQAQGKALPAYRQARCERFLKQQFPDLDCTSTCASETTRPNDQVENLTDSWIAQREVVHDLDGLPVLGRIGTPYWSGDYWRMNRGQTSYRYAQGETFETYREAIDHYEQPAEWRALLEGFDLVKMAREVIAWSPAEKYDLATGDTEFSLVNQQKNEGLRYVGEDSTIESWFGICHGWAPAAVFVPPPAAPVTSVGPEGLRVTWYPDDIRALTTLAWANGQYRTNYVGGRCHAKVPNRYPNGRISEPECFDNNPSTMHRALGNLIGRKGTPFIMDSTYDYQVWNQPIIAYEFTYFNPSKPAERSKKWRDVTVPYDDAFKAQDRFQNPLTRGVKKAGNGYDDSKVSQIVGVIATLVYLKEVSARHSTAASDNSLIRVTYTYDLELQPRNGDLVAVGGEWHQNNHPDFLWLPEKGAIALTALDREPVEVDLMKIPSATLTDLAQRASAHGNPLCRVLQPLVAASSGTTALPCSRE